MYPHQELTRLALHKRQMLRGIANERRDCATYATRVVRPLAGLDRLLTVWRGMGPAVKLAAVPAAFLALRSVSSHWQPMARLFRWLPFTLSVVRSLRR
jgi:hypothetical protein